MEYNSLELVSNTLHHFVEGIWTFDVLFFKDDKALLTCGRKDTREYLTTRYDICDYLKILKILGEYDEDEECQIIDLQEIEKTYEEYKKERNGE